MAKRKQQPQQEYVSPYQHGREIEKLLLENKMRMAQLYIDVLRSRFSSESSWEHGLAFLIPDNPIARERFEKLEWKFNCGRPNLSL